MEGVKGGWRVGKKKTNRTLNMVVGLMGEKGSGLSSGNARAGGVGSRVRQRVVVERCWYLRTVI